MLKRVKSIDALIKGKTIETITKKWNKILEATKDEDLIDWVGCDNVAKMKDYWFSIDVDWQFENLCYVSLVLCKEVA